MRKPTICIGENKGADQLRSNFVFATRIVQFLFFLNLQSLAILCACVGPGRKHKLLVLSRTGSNVVAESLLLLTPRMIGIQHQGSHIQSEKLTSHGSGRQSLPLSGTHRARTENRSDQNTDAAMDQPTRYL